MTRYVALLNNHQVFSAPTLPDCLEHLPRHRIHAAMCYEFPENGRGRVVLPDEKDKALMALDSKHFLDEQEYIHLLEKE